MRSFTESTHPRVWHRPGIQGSCNNTHRHLALKTGRPFCCFLDAVARNPALFLFFLCYPRRLNPAITPVTCRSQQSLGVWGEVTSFLLDENRSNSPSVEPNVDPLIRQILRPQPFCRSTGIFRDHAFLEHVTCLSGPTGRDCQTAVGSSPAPPAHPHFHDITSFCVRPETHIGRLHPHTPGSWLHGISAKYTECPRVLRPMYTFEYLVGIREML